MVTDTRFLEQLTATEDASELNFKIVGDGWDKEISNVTATVRFQDKKLSFLKGWAHVNANGHLTVDKEKGLVKAEVATLPEATFLELHLLFPNSLVSQNKKQHSGEIAAKVVDQEKALAKETAAKSRHNVYVDRLALLPYHRSFICRSLSRAESRAARSRPRKKLATILKFPPSARPRPRSW